MLLYVDTQALTPSDNVAAVDSIQVKNTQPVFPADSTEVAQPDSIKVNNSLDPADVQQSVQQKESELQSKEQEALITQRETQLKEQELQLKQRETMLKEQEDRLKEQEARLKEQEAGLSTSASKEPETTKPASDAVSYSIPEGRIGDLVNKLLSCVSPAEIASAIAHGKSSMIVGMYGQGNSRYWDKAYIGYISGSVSHIFSPADADGMRIDYLTGKKVQSPVPDQNYFWFLKK